MTEQRARPQDADAEPPEPTTEPPESGAGLDAQPTPLAQPRPLAQDEPIDAHSEPEQGSERAIEPEAEHPVAARPGEHVGEHVDEHDTAGGHGHEEPRVGPIDWAAWGYAAAGVVVALVLVYAFWVAAY